MKNTDGALSFDAWVNNSNFKKQIDEMSARVRGLSSITEQETKRMEGSFDGLGRMIAGAFSAIAMADFARQVVNVRGEFQQLEVAFTTMLGSKEKSDKLMSELVRTAAITPFGMQEVAQGAKQLLAYGTAAEDVNETLTRLGDISAGLSVPLNDLVYLYGTTMVQGRLFAQDVRQFTGRGIPLVRELAEMYGVTAEEINAMVSAGQIGFADVQKVINKMTDSGGQFYNLMKEQSKTLTGQISNLEDAWDNMLNSIGKGQEGLLSSVIGGATSIVENYEKVLDVLKIIIATYGAYKAAIIFAHMAEKARDVAGEIKRWYDLAKGIMTAKQAQEGFNAATKANLLGALASAIAAVVSAIIVFNARSKDTEGILNSLRESTEKLASAGKEIDSLVSEYEALKDKTERTAEENSRLNEIMQALADNVPGAVREFNAYGQALDINTEKVKEYSKAQKEAALYVTREDLKAAEKRLAGIRAELKEEEQKFRTGTRRESFTTATGMTYSRDVSLTQKEITEASRRARTLYEEEAQALQEIANAQAAIRAISGQKSSEEQYAEMVKASEEAAKEEEERRKKEEEDRQKAIEEQQSALKEYEKYLSDTKKAYDDYSDAFQGALDEDKEAVKEYYSDLRKEGEDYSEFLKNEAEKQKGNMPALNAIYQAAAKSGIQLSSKMQGLDMKEQSPTLKIEMPKADKTVLEEAVKDTEAVQDNIRQAILYQDRIELAENLIDSAYAAQDVARAVSEIDADLGSALMKVADLIGGVGNVISTLNDSNASGFQKASGIISLAITAGGELAKQRKNWANAELDAQREINAGLANQLSIEGQINALKRQRAKASEEQSAFLSPDAMKQFKNTLTAVSDAEAELEKNISALMGNAIFTAEGKAKRRLFGTKTDDYSFSMKQIMGDYAAAYGGEGMQDLLFGQMNVALQNGSFKDFLGGLLDPAGIFGGYADRKAEGNALSKLRKAFNETFTAMGKTSADVAKMTTEEWTDFFTTMDNLGYITDEATRKMVSNAQTAAEGYAQAMDEMRGIINDVAGDLGSSLESTLVNAFKNGTNAAEDFKDVVNDVLQSMMMKELITPYFQRYFDKLQEDMEKSMDGGDGVWTDDVMRFAEDMSKAIPGAVTMMEEMDKALQGAGYKGFTGGDTASALTGGIKGMSEDTASILSGYINAIRIGQIEQTSVIRQQLLYMSEIAANTRYNSYLQSIDRRLATMANDNLRAQGLS